MARALAHLAALSLLGFSTTLALGQTNAPQVPSGNLPDLLIDQPEVLPQWVVLELKSDLESARRLSNRASRKEVEKELRTIRHRYLRGSDELRQIGLSKVRAFADQPDLYPVLLEIFGREDNEIRAAILDMIMEQDSPEGDITLAWAAIHERTPWMREQALNRLKARIDENHGKVEQGIAYIVAHRLLEGDKRYVALAAGLADNLSIVQVIPHLIQAQVGGAAGGGGARGGDKAWILIGRQIGFVSDLTPIVSDSAVGFDPTISVITEGALLRIQDGVVITYISEVQVPLMRLGSRAIGYDMAQRKFGYDQEKWWTWYYDELVPALAANDAGTEIVGS